MFRDAEIRLRAVEPGDVNVLLEMENDPAAWKVSNTLAPYSRFQMEQYVLNAPNDIHANRQLRLMIEWTTEKHHPMVVGATDLFDIDLIHRRAGVGILILHPYREKGFAQTALEMLVQYAFNVLSLHQLYCTIPELNIASVRLFEKNHFVKTGVRKDWFFDGKSWQSEWVYQRIRDDE